MNKIKALFLASIMILSVAFVAGTLSSNNSFSATAQTVTVRRKNRGVAGRTWHGGKYVVRRTWDGTKWVSKKVWVGTKWTSRKVVKGTKWTAHKTKRGTKATISRTKKIFR